MNRTLIFCVMISLFSCSFLIHAQEVSREETLRQFHEDVGLETDELARFAKSIQPLMREAQQDMVKRMQEKGKNLTPAEQSALMSDFMTEIGATIREEAKKTFSNEKAQKLHLRMFQLMQGTIDASEKSNDINVVMGAMGVNTFMMAAGQPDSLELTDDQKSQIAAIQKDVTFKLGMAMQDGTMKSIKENPELAKKQEELLAKFWKAKSQEEKDAIEQQIQAGMMNQMAPSINDLKKVIADGKARYWRVLTDRQKAKYEQIMAHIRDYLWYRMPQNHGNTRDWKPGIFSWVPGMGAPEGTENIREAKPQRPERERRFPGSE